MRERQAYYSFIPALPAGTWMLMVMISLTALAGCQQGRQDHSEHQQNTVSKVEAHVDRDSMGGMNHSGREGMQGSNIGRTGRTQMKSSSNENWNSLATNRTVIARQKLAAPVYKAMDFKFSGNGFIDFDMRRNHKIPVRMGGRIERLFVKYNKQYVRKGEKLLELYSPELNTYIEEYLFIKTQTTDSVLQARARQKLLLLGLSSGQLKQIGQRGHTSLSIPVYSPFGGYVLFDPSGSVAMGSTQRGSGSMDGGMNAANKQASDVPGTVLADNSIREGMYVSKDETLFWINDFKVAWGIIAVGKENEKYLRIGQAVTVYSELLPGKPIQTSVQLIEQVYQAGQKFSQARVDLPNGSGRLKQNSLITASVSVPVRSLVIPASSVYDLGRGAMAWVLVGRSKAGASIFQSRLIRTGRRSQQEVEVLSGLKMGDQIALDAGYLTDSETLIQLNKVQYEK